MPLFAVFYGLDWVATVPPTIRLAENSFGKGNAAVMFGWIAAAHQIGAASAAWATFRAGAPQKLHRRGQLRIVTAIGEQVQMVLTNPEVCSCSALRQAARHLTRLYDAELASVGLGLNQYSILAKLDRFGPQSIQGLAALQVMDRSTLGRLLRPLERRKLVTLTVDKRDRRSRQVELTRAGKALMRKACPLWAAAEHQFVHSFGEDAARDLRTTLRQVTTVEFPASDRVGPR